MKNNHLSAVEPSRRSKLVQDVIDRINECGEKYMLELNKLNKTYTVNRSKEVICPRKFEDLNLPKNIKISKTVLPYD